LPPFFGTGQGLVAADGPFLNFANFGQGKDWSLPMDLSFFSSYLTHQVPLTWRLIALNYLFQV
jgi:hypothetical protein